MDNALIVDKISKSFSEPVLKNVSFSLAKGCICGLVGPNGAGKSTLLKILSGLLSADSGTFLWEGQPFHEGGYPKIGAMIEEPCFYPWLSGYDNLEILGQLAGDCSKKDIDLSLKSIGLYPKKDELYKNYSLGMKQRLYFALASMRKPQFLLLDEPFNGIDPIALNDLEETIRIFAKAGSVILISSHQIRELQTLVDKALFIDRGEIVYDNDDAQHADLFKDFLANVHSEGEAE